jgi:lipoxygenase
MCVVGAETGLEKERVTAFAHKTLVEGHYEAEFKVPASFGPVGAVLVENEHHKETFIREIKLVTGGDDSTAVTLDCNSWVHSKFDNPEKRVFFTLKVSSSGHLAISMMSVLAIARYTYIQSQYIYIVL